MSDPSFVLQEWVWRTLSASMAAIPGIPVFDHVPQRTQPPYLFMAGWQVLADKADCLDGSEIFFDVQCVSGAPGRREAASMAARTLIALDGQEPELLGFAAMAVEHRTTRYIRDEDGHTTRAVLTFRALAEPA